MAIKIEVGQKYYWTSKANGRGVRAIKINAQMPDGSFRVFMGKEMKTAVHYMLEEEIVAVINRTNAKLVI